MNKRAFLLAVLLVCSPDVVAAIHFSDGAYHRIDYVIDDCVYVDEGMPGVGTHIEVTSSGGIAPNKDYGYIAAYGDSRVTISGGQLGWSLWCGDSSTALVKDDAYIRGELASFGHAFITFEGGSVRLATVATEDSIMHIAGGSIGWSLELRDHAEVLLSGGDLENKIMSGGAGSTDDTCIVTCVGNGFAVNGTPVGYGDSARDYAAHGTYSGHNCLTGTITGTLANGDTLNNTFYIFSDSDIVFIPEPTTLLLFGLGGFALIRNRRK